MNLYFLFIPAVISNTRIYTWPMLCSPTQDVQLVSAYALKAGWHGEKSSAFLKNFLHLQVPIHLTIQFIFCKLDFIGCVARYNALPRPIKPLFGQGMIWFIKYVPCNSNVTLYSNTLWFRQAIKDVNIFQIFPRFHFNDLGEGSFCNIMLC